MMITHLYNLLDMCKYKIKILYFLFVINMNMNIYNFYRNLKPIVSTTQDTCRKYNGFYPSFTPEIMMLSTTKSISGQYSLVYIFGVNFFLNGTTYVNFGSYTNIPITYYSSNNISFVVPLNASVGTYNVTVVNIYNGNFSPPVKYTYAGNLNYSNILTYEII